MKLLILVKFFCVLVNVCVLVFCVELKATAPDRGIRCRNKLNWNLFSVSNKHGCTNNQTTNKQTCRRGGRIFLFCISFMHKNNVGKATKEAYLLFPDSHRLLRILWVFSSSDFRGVLKRKYLLFRLGLQTVGQPPPPFPYMSAQNRFLCLP